MIKAHSGGHQESQKQANATKQPPPPHHGSSSRTSGALRTGGGGGHTPGLWFTAVRISVYAWTNGERNQLNYLSSFRVAQVQSSKVYDSWATHENLEEKVEFLFFNTQLKTTIFLTTQAFLQLIKIENLEPQSLWKCFLILFNPLSICIRTNSNVRNYRYFFCSMIQCLLLLDLHLDRKS